MLWDNAEVNMKMTSEADISEQSQKIGSAWLILI